MLLILLRCDIYCYDVSYAVFCYAMLSAVLSHAVCCYVFFFAMLRFAVCYAVFSVLVCAVCRYPILYSAVMYAAVLGCCAVILYYCHAVMLPAMLLYSVMLFFVFM